MLKLVKHDGFLTATAMTGIVLHAIHFKLTSLQA
jgi:hypothetical protein